MTPLYFLFSDSNKNNIYIKRDDLIPISFGGNKARKAMNFFKEIDQGGFDCVVTYGSGSSNHCRIVSNMAASRKLPCYIVAPKESSLPTFNSKMMELFGSHFMITPVNEVHDTIERLLATLKEEGKKPYFIAGGWHGNLGTQAYVDCYKEIAVYEHECKIHFGLIFLASGTGTTQAGLVCGQLMSQDKRKIIGISIARKNPRGKQVVLDSSYEYLASKGIYLSKIQLESEIVFVDDYVGLGYGTKSKDIDYTINSVLVNFGIPMDSTYTAKAYTGMIRYIQENNVTGENILFIHTGGTPLFFDDLMRLENII